MDDIFIDWPAFWARDRTDVDWLYEPILARGRGHAIFAWQKTGKSLLTAAICAELALRPRILVIYLDYEMTEEDVYDRFSDMGYDETTDFSRFRYALLPSLPPLDTQEGARALLAILDAERAAWPACHPVVIIDTMSRAVHGDENEADTIRRFYRYTGLALKQRRVTWARLDHAGKDREKGQRGSSAKGDDVDVIWRMEEAEDGYLLHREAARMSWVPEKVAIRKLDEPLRFRIVGGVLPAGTYDLVSVLEELGVLPGTPVRTTRKILTESGHTATQGTLAAACKVLRIRAVTLKPDSVTGISQPSRNGSSNDTPPPLLATE